MQLVQLAHQSMHGYKPIATIKNNAMFCTQWVSTYCTVVVSSDDIMYRAQITVRCYIVKRNGANKMIHASIHSKPHTMAVKELDEGTYQTIK